MLQELIMFMLLGDFMDHIWWWIGGGVGIVFLILLVMVLPDIVRYIRIKSM
jgi:hypothetical protein